jgi:hypothetical protein
MRQILNRLIFVLIISVFFIEIFNDTHSFVNLPFIVHHQSERNHSELPVNPFCLENHEVDLLNFLPSIESVKLQIVIGKLSLWNFSKANAYSGSIFHPPRLS